MEQPARHSGTLVSSTCPTAASLWSAQRRQQQHRPLLNQVQELAALPAVGEAAAASRCTVLTCIHAGGGELFTLAAGGGATTGAQHQPGSSVVLATPHTLTSASVGQALRGTPLAGARVRVESRRQAHPQAQQLQEDG